jgi:CheY-like chemotaxis protein/anti-sigma regulatory factor (Ser/Thr protein kinase)
MAERQRVTTAPSHHDLGIVEGRGPGVRPDDEPGAPARVLLVDDRADNLMALEAVLEPLGYELISARSGHEALRILLDVDVSAIVLDVQMPDMDGFEAAALLKSREATSSIPVLFLTAVGLSVEHELRGYEVGGADYICKPSEPRVLQAKVRAAVRWGSEVKVLREANRVYEEAAGALAGVSPHGAGALAGVSPHGAAQHRGALEAASHGRPVVTERRLDLRLHASLSSPAAARAAIREAMAGENDERVDVAVLLVSELLANAVLYAGTDICLRLDVGGDVMRVEVEDSGAEMPDPMTADVTAETGRGWLLVEKLTDRCGWNRLPDGKVVWFELHL